MKYLIKTILFSLHFRVLSYINEENEKKIRDYSHPKTDPKKRSPNHQKSNVLKIPLQIIIKEEVEMQFFYIELTNFSF